MKTVFDRLEKLYSAVLIDTSNGEVNAEIQTICDEIGKLYEYLGKIGASTAINIFTFPDSKNIEKALSPFDYTVSGRKVTVSGYDIDTVGKVFNAWFGILFDVYLNGKGKPWSYLDGESLSWDDIKQRDIRWTMAESR